MKVAKEHNVVPWWKYSDVLFSTEQANYIGLTKGPFWRNGQKVEGPFPQMRLYLLGFVR